MNLALKDLEIRGAGNLLGKEQSGFIGEIGFDMYMQLLDEAVAELKETIPAESLPADTMQQLTQKSNKPKFKDVLVESDISMFLPETYIDDENTRLEIYQRLSKVTSQDELNEIRLELEDRFGKLTDEVTSLLQHIEIKLILSPIGFEKIVISGEQLELFFDLNNENIYTSGYFEKVLGFINEHFKNTSRVKQSKNSLSVLFRIPKQSTPAEKLTEIHNFVGKLAEL